MKSPPPVEISILRAAAWDTRQPPAPPGDLPANTQTSDLSSILLQLATSVLTNLPPHLRQHTAIILGTPHGCLQADWEFDRSRREFGGRYASPAAFARTLPSTLPAELSVKLALQGPLLTISAGLASTALALRRAPPGCNISTSPTASPAASTPAPVPPPNPGPPSSISRKVPN